MSENEEDSVQVNEQVAEKAKKLSPKPSSEKKEKALNLLRDGQSINEVVEETKIGKVTIKKYADKIAAEKAAEAAATDLLSSSIPSEIKSLKALLAEISAEKVKIKQLLEGELQRQLDDLTDKERAIQGVINLYEVKP